MKVFTLVNIAIVALLLSTAPARADIGDQLTKLHANDGVENDQFGVSVAISDTIAIVGAHLDDDNGDFSGSAYLYDISDPVSPQQIAKINPINGAAGEKFGISVAISDTIAIIGAYRDNENGAAAGAAYIFDISDPANPIQIAKLLAFDGADGDAFGWSVAFSGNKAVIGAKWDDDNGDKSGSAYLYNISDPTNPTHIAKLLPGDGDADDEFGYSVATSGITAIVGAHQNDDNGSNSGSIYLFDTTTGMQLLKFLPNDGEAGDQFGFSISVSGTTAIVGANQDDDNGSDSGSAYLLDMSDPMNAVQTAKLQAEDGEAGDQFGYSVALADTTAIVGARNDDDSGIDSGSAYLFGISDKQNPIQTAKVLPSDGEADDNFANSVAIIGATTIVGAWHDEDNGFNSGSAYLFVANEEIDFDPPELFSTISEALIETVGSFDLNNNDSQDVAVIVSGLALKGKGSVQIFLNQGNDKAGDWNGLESGELIPVGTAPSSIATGLFNADAYPDLAVSNAGDNQISILLGDGFGSFIAGETIDVGQEPNDVSTADLNLDGNIDLLVANTQDDDITVLYGDGKGGFAQGGNLPSGGFHPINMEPEDLDDDKNDDDIAGVNSQIAAGGKGINGSVFVIIGDGKGGFEPAVNYPVGNDPRQLALADLDGDTFVDITVVNNADATISVLLNLGDGTFAPEIVFGVGTNPRSIDAVDLDEDGDPDLVIAADDANGIPVVQVLTNISSGIGAVEFATPLEFNILANPNFVSHGDFNADALQDIVTANSNNGGKAGGGGSVTVLLNNPPPIANPCPWDLDGNGAVGTSDLLDLFSQWGPCQGCPADFDGDGMVRKSDILELFANWGPCP